MFKFETISRWGYTLESLTPCKVRVFNPDTMAYPVTVSTLLADADSNPKTDKVEVVSKVFSASPHRLAGIGNMCPMADTCIEPCLNDQGHGRQDGPRNARIARSAIYHLNREWFWAKLDREFKQFRERHTGPVGCRMNMFTDVRWERYGLMDRHPDIVYWDYTKLQNDRFGWVRPNYFITVSYDGTNAEYCRHVLANGGNVSVVFYNADGGCGKAAHRQTLPDTFLDCPVIDGGVTDYRPADPRGVIVGLRLLALDYTARNKAIDSGFAQLC